MGYNVFMKRNFELLMMEQLKGIEKGTRLLLHSCCAPCSSTCLERLKEYFSVTVLYYNPNIDEREEYEKRKAEQIRFLQETGWADFLDCDHDAVAFEEMSKGLEQEPERGKRCYLCYALRLEKTAEIAKANGYGCVSIKLYLQRQMEGRIWTAGHSWPTRSPNTLLHTNKISEWNQCMLSPSVKGMFPMGHLQIQSQHPGNCFARTINNSLG